MIFVIFGSSHHTDTHSNVNFSDWFQFGFKRGQNVMIDSWAFLTIGRVGAWVGIKYRNLTAVLYCTNAVQTWTMQNVSTRVWDILVSF